MSKNIQKYLLLVFAGVITPFAFPPFDVIPTVFVGHLILFVLIIRSNSSVQAFTFGLVFAIAEYLFGFYWLFSIIEGYQLGYQVVMTIIILGIISLISVFVGLSAFVIKRYYHPSVLWFSLFPASIFAIFEWLKSWLFTGFPWYSVADALGNTGVYSLLPIIGYLGVGFIFYVVIGLLSYVVLQRNVSSIVVLVISLLCIALFSWFAKDIQWTKDYHELSARIITGNYEKNQVGNRAQSIDRFTKYLHLSNVEPVTELTVWPESTINVNYQEVSPHLNNTKSDKTSIFAGIYYNKYGKSTNTIFSLDNSEPVYYKEHLIPFGEYTPSWFTPLKPLIPSLNMDDLTLIENTPTFSYKNIKMFGSICYEALFSEELLKRAGDAHLHIHVSNLGWFDNSIAVDYLFNVLKIRAIETSKPIIYSVNQGYSAFIDHKGNAIKVQDIEGVFAMDSSVITQEGTTFYQQYKNLPLLFCIAFVLIAYCTRILLSRRYK